MEIAELTGGIAFRVRVTLRASHNGIEGEYQGALKVRLSAPPVDGKANNELRRLLAARLNVPISAVKIVSGEKSRAKRIVVAGVTKAQVAALAATAEIK
jgi:uncharacterized protein (TIGR00251 family)